MRWDDEANMGVFGIKKSLPLSTPTPGHPLLVTAIFYGDSPNLGFSYMTDGGEWKPYVYMELRL